MRLLADLRDVFGEQDKLWTETILAGLHRIPEAPWGDWYGHPLKDRELARLLKPYGIRSRDVKNGGTNHKGYYREQFTESWRSYARPPGGCATGATSATAQVNGQMAKATPAAPTLAPGDAGEPPARARARRPGRGRGGRRADGRARRDRRGAAGSVSGPVELTPAARRWHGPEPASLPVLTRAGARQIAATKSRDDVARPRTRPDGR